MESLSSLIYGMFPVLKHITVSHNLCEIVLIPMEIEIHSVMRHL